MTVFPEQEKAMQTKAKTIALTLNWRDAARTMHCVESLLDQDIDHVLVWDNSEDNGASFTELAHLLSGNPKVSIVQSPTNLGFAAGVNRGLDWIIENLPEAEFALLINNDATMAPGGVEELRNALNAKQEAWLAYPDINHGGHVFGDVYYHRYTGLITLTRLSGSFPYTSGCCQLFALNRIQRPLYDEDFFMYGEDIELGWRLSRIPGSTAHVRKTMVHHEGSASSKIGSPFYEQRMVAAHLILAKKQAKNQFDYLALLAGRIIMLVARACLRSLRNLSTVPIKALASGWNLAKHKKH